MIYIHIPFCHRKCTYCAFYSLGARGSDVQRDYVDALLAEMCARHEEQRHPVRTVYLGGGTPSLLAVDELARVVDGLRGCFDLSQVEEATIECNPEDLGGSYLRDLAALRFFNRVSIGVQSLDDGMLRLLGRRHTAAQALEAVQLAHDAGLHNVSVDFMYGLPRRADAHDAVVPAADPVSPDWRRMLARVNHVSAYALTVEPGTALAVQVEAGRVALPSDDEVVRQYHAVRQGLAESGFRQYEVSNYARPGFHSRHNSRYWDRTPYVGLGPGAHSFDGSRRRWNLPDLHRYIVDPLHAFESEALTPADACNELVMTSLRTVQGLDTARLPDGLRQRVTAAADRYVKCRWLTAEGSWLRPTEEGLLHADGMSADMFV